MFFILFPVSFCMVSKRHGLGERCPPYAKSTKHANLKLNLDLEAAQTIATSSFQSRPSAIHLPCNHSSAEVLETTGWWPSHCWRSPGQQSRDGVPQERKEKKKKKKKKKNNNNNNLLLQPTTTICCFFFYYFYSSSCSSSCSCCCCNHPHPATQYTSLEAQPSFRSSNASLHRTAMVLAKRRNCSANAQELKIPKAFDTMASKHHVGSMGMVYTV